MISNLLHFRKLFRVAVLHAAYHCYSEKQLGLLEKSVSVSLDAAGLLMQNNVQ